MVIVIHKIKGQFYAYDHVRVGDKVRTTYLYPVNMRTETEYKHRRPQHGGGRPS